MNNYKISIMYDGTRYNGWQSQKNTANTIQEKLAVHISELLDESIEIIGSGRTDAGVHALSQTANFKTNILIKDNYAFLLEINKRLPNDIAITDIEKVPLNFHARFNATGKKYVYKIFTAPHSPVFDRNFYFHHPEPINLEKAKILIPYLTGSHDYAIFCDNHRMKKSTVRTVSSIALTQNDDSLEFEFEGTGFLYHMVRKMMGLILYCGTHALSEEDIRNIGNMVFSLNEWPKNWPLAPAKGLTLKEVLYE